MAFFDKKEDVLDIELTKYGQYQLSKGLLKPTYYAFFDDDILYDGAYFAVTESQNDTETRIEETPRLRTQYLFSGVETNYNRQKEILGNANNPVSTTHEADNAPGGAAPLGKSKYGEQNYPAWSLKLFDGEISSVWVDNTNAYLAYKPAPEIDLSCQVFTGDSSVLSPADHGGIDGRVTIASDFYDDGSLLVLNSDELLIRIEEKNTDFQTDNFEIEVFEVVTHTLKNGDEYERANKLMFSNSVSGDDAVDLEQFSEQEVEFYMTILADHEIPTSIFCAKVPKEQRESYFMGFSDECQDDDKIRADIYVKEEEGEEIC